MPKLNKNQLTQLGDYYLKLAQAVGDYRIAHYHKLKPLQKKRIREYHKNLIDYADTYYAASTNFIVEDAEASLASIGDISNGLQEDIKKVSSVQLIVNTIGAAVRLGASIISKQPKAIAASLKDLVKAYENLKKTKTS